MIFFTFLGLALLVIGVRGLFLCYDKYYLSQMKDNISDEQYAIFIKTLFGISFGLFAAGSLLLWLCIWSSSIFN
jgi:hypothetical protein